MAEHIAYLGLGSNLGDRAANLLRAIAALISGGLSLTAASSIYETEPVDYLEQPQFLNMAVAVGGATLEPFSLLEFCLETELKLGRIRNFQAGPRTIDIDLLMLDHLIINETRPGANLELPHPRMHERRFVLAPLSEIAPRLLHPVFGVTISHLLEQTGDPSGVRIYRQ